MRKIFWFPFLVVLFAFTTCFAAESQSQQPEHPTVQADYYYAFGCGFCEKLEPWLSKIAVKHNDDLTIHWIEVSLNQDGLKKYVSMVVNNKVPSERRGTPTLYINGKVLVGNDEIKSHLEEEFAKAKEAMSKSDSGKTDSTKTVPETEGSHSNKPISDEPDSDKS